MPIRSHICLALTVAGSVACGLLVPAEAGPLDDAYVVRTQARDLTPTPGNPGGKRHRPHVTLQPSASVVPVGAPVSFYVRSSINGYGHLYVMSASGRAQVWMENVPISAGRRLTFPTGSLGIKAAAPAGREDLMLIVTRDRIDGFYGYRTTRTPRVLDYGHKTFKKALTDKFSDLPQSQWGFMRTTVRVVDRRPSGDGWGWRADQGPQSYWDDQWEDD